MPFKVNLNAVPRSLRALRNAAEETEKDSGQYILTPEQYVRLEEAIGQAWDDHIITPLPKEKPESADAYSKSRLETIRDRLKLLGYLDRHAEGAAKWEALELAVRRFQRAAFGEERLTRDGWVGEQTWGALQELVSFEEPSNLERWLVDGRPCPALKRALHLRLYALGLVETPPGPTIRPTSIDAGLSKLAAVARTLQWDDLELQTSLSDIDLATLEVIFDQDVLVARLATSRSPDGVEDKHLIRPFVIAMAKIELWLAGFEIKPDGYSADEHASADRGIDLNNDHPLYAVLIQYWDGVGKDHHSASETKAKVFVKSSFPSFFADVQALLAETEDGLPDSDIVFEQLRQKPTLLQEAWDHVYGIGARIWDGIKRAWHWFKAMVSKVVGKIAAFVKNLSRIAYQYILKSYEGVEAVIKCVCSSITFFTRPILKLPLKQLGISEVGWLVIGRDSDFDFRTLVDVNARCGEVNDMADYVTEKAKMFNLSCRFLASMLNILLSLLKTLYAGWAGLLMALLKLYKSIAHWIPIFIEAQRQEEASTVAR